MKKKTSPMKRIWAILLITLVAVYMAYCIRLGGEIQQLVYHIHEGPADPQAFSGIIPDEADYRVINCHLHFGDEVPEQYTLQVSFPMAYALPGRAKARYVVSYQGHGTPETGVSELPVIVEMVWDNGWQIDRVTAIESPEQAYEVTFP